jgi:hypothetical protein
LDIHTEEGSETGELLQSQNIGEKSMGSDWLRSNINVLLPIKCVKKELSGNNKVNSDVSRTIKTCNCVIKYSL